MRARRGKLLLSSCQKRHIHTDKKQVDIKSNQTEIQTVAQILELLSHARVCVSVHVQSRLDTWGGGWATRSSRRGRREEGLR